MSKRVGFVGLGIMGLPMAKNLIKGGVKLVVNDVRSEPVKEIVEIGGEAGSIKDICDMCDIIFTILPNGPIVKDVIFGKEGIASYIKKGSIICDLSSIAPSEAREIHKRLSEISVAYVDSPVSGGEPKAVDASLSFMAGGSEEDFERVRPYMELMGDSAVLTGDAGSGCVTKLVNQIIVNMNIATISEALVFAAKSGADVERVYKAIRGGAAGSTMLDAKAIMIMDRNFEPGGKISINRKDIKNVIDEAHNINCPVPLSANLHEIFQSLYNHGQMDEDHASIVKYFERMANIVVER